MQFIYMYSGDKNSIPQVTPIGTYYWIFKKYLQQARCFVAEQTAMSFY